MASLEALAEVHAAYGHIQEVILQNFVPHQRYYGREPADDRRRGGAPTTGSTGVADGARSGAAPAWADAGHDRGHEAADRRTRGG